MAGPPGPPSRIRTASGLVLVTAIGAAAMGAEQDKRKPASVYRDLIELTSGLVDPEEPPPGLERFVVADD